jgi:hypothetical protein
MPEYKEEDKREKESKIFTFKRADTPEDIFLVDRIRYDAYRPMGRIPFDLEGRRVLEYDRHPGTTRFIGYLNNLPAATISLTPDSLDMGVPIGKPFPEVMERLREEYGVENIAESHAIMVLPEYQHGAKNQLLLMGLERMVFRQCVMQDIRYLLVGMIKEHAEQVEKHFGFKRLAEPKKYGALKHVDEAYILGLDLHWLVKRTDWPWFNHFMKDEDPLILTPEIRRSPDLERYLKKALDQQKIS